MEKLKITITGATVLATTTNDDQPYAKYHLSMTEDLATLKEVLKELGQQEVADQVTVAELRYISDQYQIEVLLPHSG